MSQHHDGGEKKSSGVGKLLALDIGSGTVDSLEDGALVTNVARWGETKSTDQTSAHVGENVSVQVRHNEDLVVVWNGVGNHLQAGVVEQLGVELDVRELLRDFAGSAEEETVGHLHDGGLVDSADLLPADITGMLESISQDTFGSIAGNELDALDNTIDHNVLNARVFTLGVLTDQDGVNVVVGCLVAGDGSARADVGKEVEGSAEGQVEGDMALANGRSKRAFERNQALCYAGDGLVGDDSLAVSVEARGDVDRLPLDWDVCCRVDVLD